MQVERIIAKGQVIPLMFTEDAVAASQTNAQLKLMAVDTVSNLNEGYPMPWPGEIVGVSAAVDTAATAGSLAIGASVGGTEDADTTITLTTAATGYKSVPRGKATFVAGDLIGVEITSDASWNGTASDLVVFVWVLVHLEGV